MKVSFRKSGIINAMGIVFGDIGTSPIYTLTIVFNLIKPTEANILGILSLVFWTLITLVTIQYAWLGMSMHIQGEGGIIALKEILISTLKKGHKAGLIIFMGYLGISLLLGDGIITPAISILSAVEGLKLIQVFNLISLESIVIITITITVILFMIQFKGTTKIALSFGPIMLVWFIVLFLSGIYFFVQRPEVILSINPIYGVEFIFNNGLASFFILSEVILCATGGEALYADMGHLGGKPIRQAWMIVFTSLFFNYLGQGAFLLQYQDTNQILFKLISNISELFYIPFLFLALMATIIASQAMISAIMSLVFQGINTGIFPFLKIRHTSTNIRSQIYIPAVNIFLLFGVILMILIFKKSENLAAAYGLAVTATMFISSIFIMIILINRKEYFKFIFASIVFIVAFIYLVSVTTKISSGGYWSIIITIVVLSVIAIWSKGVKNIRKNLRAVELDIFLESFNQFYETKNYIN